MRAALCGKGNGPHPNFFEVQMSAYRVEVDHEGCEKCGAERTWTLIGPDRYAIGISYGKQEDAEEMADDLNEAFEKGKQSVEVKS